MRALSRWGRRPSHALGLAAALGGAACGSGSLPGGEGNVARPPAGGSEGNPARIEVRQLDARPRLTLVSRDGDPAPAVAAVFATGLGPALTTALAAIVEARVRAARFDADVRVDRSAFRLRVLLPDAARAPQLFAALASATTRPVAAGSAEIGLAVQRLQSLKRNPLDAAELVPIAACTGALGIAPGEAVPDLASAAGLGALDAARRAALHPGRASIAAVGGAAFVAAAATALARSDGWLPPGPAVEDEPAPAADAAGVYLAPALDRRSARISLAVRAPDPEAAVAAAERLGAPDSALLTRLRVLPEPWRVAQVAGVARAHGGCVGVVLEGQRAPGQAIEPAAALATAIARREIAAELAAGGRMGGRQILGAADPREAASRAAWWALASTGPAQQRSAVALGVPAADRGSLAVGPAATSARFQADLAAALGGTAGAERRLAVERGQGELWVLLASPCGVAEEGVTDAGLGALAAIAAVEARRRLGDVAIEPWITPDGIGVVAHAAFRDDREPALDLARRVADAAARTLTATVPPPEAVLGARAALLDHLERTAGHQGAALEALAPALAPDHPSWVEPLGVFRRVAEAADEGIRARAQALAFGPLRLAVLANADATQAAAAADAVDRWLSPAPGPRVCHAASPSPVRGGRVEIKLPSGAPLSQGLLGAPFPPGQAPYPYRDLAEITAAALDGPTGLLGAALGAGVTVSARVMGGARAPSLVIDVRATDAGLSAAVGEAKALLLRLPVAASEADLTRAAAEVERRERDARADPRRRLSDLWAGRRSAPQAAPSALAASARPSLTAWRAFLTATLREPALAIVEAKPQ